MKKKITVIALLLALAVLAGCAAEDAENVAGTVSPVENATEAAPVGTVETPAPTEAAEEEAVSLGRMSGGVYTNDYTGYACQLDTSWTFYTAEELQEIPENVAEILEGSELVDSGDVLTQLTDMMAENVDMLTSINVFYQKMTMQERLAYAMLDDAEILDATLSQKDAMVDAYAQAGILVETMETREVTFLGEERVALHTASTMQGIPYYTLQIFDYDLGAYSVTLTLASYVEDKTPELLELFYPVE